MKAVNLEKLLPADIPQGERVLWFGRPEPVSLWRRAYRADWVAGWFVALAILDFARLPGVDGLAGALRTLGLGAAALAILGGLALASARTTLYVVTEKRIVVKSGIALPLFINLPFKQIARADVRAFRDRTGDVTVGAVKGQRVAYLALWPSARPLHFTSPQPALRCIEKPRDVAALLSRALAEAAGAVTTTASAPVEAPAHAVAAVA